MIALLQSPDSLEPTSVSAPLSSEEKIRLGQLELAIEKNLTGFIACGRALLEIRESRLYRERYSTFAQYVRERFGLARSTADQLVRSTLVYETLSANAGMTGARISETVPEVVLRPLCALPGGDELKAQTWRLASLLSPEGKPTRTISARIARLVRESVEGNSKPNSRKPALDREVMFVRPIQRLGAVESFNADIACLHVKTLTQAEHIITSCQTVAGRCRAIEEVLTRKFSPLTLCPRDV